VTLRDCGEVKPGGAGDRFPPHSITLLSFTR
jgi:hypothetical protein